MQIKDLVFKENEVKPIEVALQTEMDKAIVHLEKELVAIRTGRAHTSLVENIQISLYGNDATPLKAIASLTAASSNMITVQPWDSSVIKEIEKAIAQSDVGITPNSDGKTIYLELPRMSSERREELLKILNKRLEECRVSIRNYRKDFNNAVRDAKKNKTISENFFNRLEDIIQKATDQYIKKAEQLAAKKETELKPS